MKDRLVGAFGAPAHFHRIKSLALAWRVIDASGDNKVSKAEWGMALRKAGVNGANQAFREFDLGRRGIITLDDFDPEAAVIVRKEQELEEERRQSAIKATEKMLQFRASLDVSKMGKDRSQVTT
eukprot:CAMPEP_0204330366 /NCGR_PEP_ID=MMETSP0469-20131031/14869_1 /ASSEMBLY_ACC=CAM_ASM_000384 /TAXON_ID=2969 /ORGANISM="Oxyrrhis marina" /LENGTH=123 /DNA_ID=CAMNT_0051313149 /DNA_START=10 /DNA_END=377 /DNA_ORIENTATION=-